MAFIEARSEVHAALEQAERCVAATGQALLSGDAEQLRSLTGELHDSAHALALALRGIDSRSPLIAAARERLAQVARDIAMQREALLRRSAAVDRSVHSLLPQSRPNTYAAALGRYGARSVAGPALRSF